MPGWRTHSHRTPRTPPPLYTDPCHAPLQLIPRQGEAERERFALRLPARSSGAEAEVAAGGDGADGTAVATTTTPAAAPGPVDFDDTRGAWPVYEQSFLTYGRVSNFTQASAIPCKRPNRMLDDAAASGSGRVRAVHHPRQQQQHI